MSALAQFRRVANACSIDCDHCKHGRNIRRPVYRPATTVVRYSEHTIAMWLCDDHAGRVARGEDWS